MKAQRTKKTEVTRWITVDMTATEAYELMSQIRAVGSPPGPLLALWNNLTDAYGSNTEVER